jgi:hypothetical protein
MYELITFVLNKTTDDASQWFAGDEAKVVTQLFIVEVLY